MDIDMEKIQKNVMNAFGIKEDDNNKNRSKEEDENGKYSKEYIKDIIGF